MIALNMIRAVYASCRSTVYRALLFNWLGMPTRELCEDNSPVTHLKLLPSDSDMSVSVSEGAETCEWD